MTVDTEAIFALVDEYGLSRDAFEELTGSMATAWFDERLLDTLFIARGVGRPLWLGEGKHEAFFASTKDALEITRALSRSQAEEAGASGRHRRCTRERQARPGDRFNPDRAFEESSLPAVRAPHEGAKMPPAPGCDRRRRRLRRAFRRHLGPLLEQPLADEVLERRPGADSAAPTRRAVRLRRRGRQAPPPGSSIR